MTYFYKRKRLKDMGGARMAGIFLIVAAILSICLAIWLGIRKPESPAKQKKHSLPFVERTV